MSTPDSRPEITPAERLEDRRLVTALLAGEESATRRLKAACEVLARNLTRRFRFTDEDAEDLANEVLHRIFENDCAKLQSFAFRCRLEEWLAIVVLNAARDRHRQQMRRDRRQAQEAARSQTSSEQPESEAILQRLGQEADAAFALAGLEPEAERLVRLRYFEGYSLALLALVSGLSEQAVSARIYRALKVMARRLQERDAAYQQTGEEVPA